jgi:hypothetical protein
VVRDSEGRYFAPHVPAGRVQVYDADKEFLCAWEVSTGGNTFLLSVAEDDTIVVFTARRALRLVFDREGTPLRYDHYTESFDDLPRDSHSTEYFSTPIWFLPFTDPSAAFLLLVVGFGGLILAGSWANRRNRHAGEPDPGQADDGDT